PPAGGSEMKLPWQDTDDCARKAVQDNSLTQNICPSAESVLPGFVADHYRVGRGRGVLVQAKIAADQRSDAKRTEEPGTYARARHRLRPSAGAQCEAAVQSHRHPASRRRY